MRGIRLMLSLICLSYTSLLSVTAVRFMTEFHSNKTST